MNRLVIDDVREFKFDCTYARSAREAIAILEERHKWDEVWFDYDLGQVYGQLEIFDTVMPVISWLEEAIFFGYKPQIGLCVIHTSNPAGRNLLDLTLSKHYSVKHVDALPYCRPFSEWQLT